MPMWRWVAALYAMIGITAALAAFPLGGIVPTTSVIAGCTINSVSNSTGTTPSFSFGVNNASVGTASSSLTGTCAPNTWSLSGTDAAHFTINSSAGVLTTNGTLTSGSCASTPCSINIVDTIAGAAGSPQSLAISPTGVGCTITAVNTSGTGFTANTLHAVVGTVSSTTTGTCGSDSFSISGTDAASFQFSGTTLETSTAAGTTLNPGTYSIVLTDTISGAAGSPFAAPPGSGFAGTLTASGGTVTLVSITPSTFSTGPGPFTGTVGTITVNTTGGAFSGTLAKDTASTCAGSPSADNALFSLSTTASPSNVTTTSRANGTYHVCVSATQVAATGSPLYQALTITISSVTNLTNMVMVETQSLSETNVPFTIGVPLAPSVLDASHHIVATSGVNGALTCQEDNRASDLTPSVRMTTLSCINPSLGSGVTDTIALTVAAGAPASGPDISVANLQAANTASSTKDFNSKVTIVDASGNTFVASPLDALNSGNSGWVNTTTATVMGKWRTGGGVVTGYVLYAPLKNGGTPHAFLSVKWDMECYKPSTGAVSGTTLGSGNPVINCKTTASLQSGIIQNSSGAIAGGDQWYSLAVGSTGTPTACANFPTLSPTYDLALTAGIDGATANTQNRYSIATASTGTPFTINNIGSLVSDNTGYGIIAGQFTANQTTPSYPTTTQLNLGVIKPFAGTTLTHGSYKIFGVNHPYGLRYRVNCNWVPSGNAQNVDLKNGNLYLGNAWAGSPGTNIGPWDYVNSTLMALNYQAAATGFTNVDPVAILGTNPTGFNSGHACGSPCLYAGFAGGNANGLSGTNWLMYQQTSGPYDGLSPLPYSQLGAMKKWDASAAAAMFTNTDRFGLLPYRFIDSSTGRTTAMTTGTDYGLNGTAVNFLPTADTSLYSYGGGNPNREHPPDPYFMPYALSGDWWYLDNDLDWVFGIWTQINTGYSGGQLNRTFLSSPGTGFNTRGEAHWWRNLGHMALILPDSDTNSTPSAVIGWTKDDTKAWLENQYTAVNSGVYNDYSVTPTGTPGAIIQLGACTQGGGGTCPGGIFATKTVNPNWVTPGVRFAEVNGNQPFLYAQYQANYMAVDAASLKETGMLSTNGQNVFNWWMVGLISWFTDTTDLPSTSGVSTGIPGPAVYWWDYAGLPIAYSWAAEWKLSANDIGVWQSGSAAGRSPNGTMTLSATSGSAITATMPATGYLNGGAAFYTGGYVWTPNDNGYAKITGRPSATTLTLDTTCTGTAPHFNCGPFGTTSYTNNSGNYNVTTPQWVIPWPAPGDLPGLENAKLIAQWTAGTSQTNNDYDQIQWAATLLACSYTTDLTGSVISTGCGGAWPPPAVVISQGLRGNVAPTESDWNIGHR